MDGIQPIADLGLAISDFGLKEANFAHLVDPQSQAVEHSDEQKKQLAKDFESVLLTRLFEQVQESTGNWGLEEEDGTSQQVQGLFWLFLARDVADKGGFGLWQDLYRQFQQMEGIGDPGEGIREEL